MKGSQVHPQTSVLAFIRLPVVNARKQNRPTRTAKEIEKIITRPGIGISCLAYRVPSAVFHKPSDYSSLEDSSVRVHARHLRLKLHEYFDEEGRNEPIVLTRPRGCYTPIFKPSIARRFDFRRSGYPCGSFTLLLQRWSEPTITGPACCGRGAPVELPLPSPPVSGPLAAGATPATSLPATDGGPAQSDTYARSEDSTHRD